MPQYRTGTHSRFLAAIPEDWKLTVEDAYNDPELYDQRKMIATLNGMIVEQLRDYGMGEAMELWQQAKEQWDEVLDLLNKSDELDQAEFNRRFGKASRELSRLLDEGVGDHYRRKEITKLMQDQAKLVETEGRRQERIHSIITMDKAMAMIEWIILQVKGIYGSDDRLNQLVRRAEQTFSESD